MDELSPVFEKMSQFFSLLSEPMRIRILHAICQQERSVGEIAAATGATQTNVFRHLNAMYRAGALARRKQGAFVLYGVADRSLTDLCRNVCIHVGNGTESVLINGSAPPSMASGSTSVAEIPCPASSRKTRSPEQRKRSPAHPAAGAFDGSQESN